MIPAIVLILHPPMPVEHPPVRFDYPVKEVIQSREPYAARPVPESRPVIIPSWPMVGPADCGPFR